MKACQEKYQGSDDPVFRTRAVSIKEERADLVKHHLWVLWTDYFKPEHLEKYPNLHDLSGTATKEAGAAEEVDGRPGRRGRSSSTRSTRSPRSSGRPRRPDMTDPSRRRYERGLPDYHDPSAGFGGAPPAQSALTLRLVLACFGLVVCAGGVGLFLTMVRSGWCAGSVAAAAALVDIIVVVRRKARGEPG